MTRVSLTQVFAVVSLVPGPWYQFTSDYYIFGSNLSTILANLVFSVKISDHNPVPNLPLFSRLYGAYPNPFKVASQTSIPVDIKEMDSGTVSIYNVTGKLVMSYSLTPGNHILRWNGKDRYGNNCGSGVYFYKLKTAGVNQTKKMLILQ